MTQIIEAVEDSPLIQVPQNTPSNQNKTFYHQNNLRCNYGKRHQSESNV
jgi:hypothetical protein